MSLVEEAALHLIEGDTESQFATIISRLEHIRLYDSRTRIQIRLSPVIIQLNGLDTFCLRFRGYSIVPGTAVGMSQCTSKMLVTAIDAAHLTNPETRGIMLASVSQGANREIYLKTLTVCGGAESNDS